MQWRVEGEDDRRTAGEFLPAVMLEPPDSDSACADAQSNQSANAACDHGAGHHGAGGGQTYHSGRLPRVGVVHDGSFSVDVGCRVVIQVRDLSAQGIDRAIGQADRIRLQADAGAAAMNV